MAVYLVDNVEEYSYNHGHELPVGAVARPPRPHCWFEWSTAEHGGWPGSKASCLVTDLGDGFHMLFSSSQPEIPILTPMFEVFAEGYEDPALYDLMMHFGIQDPHDEGALDDRQVDWIVRSYTGTVLMSLALLNCRNVEAGSSAPPLKPKTRNRMRGRGAPVLRHHQIKLVVPRRGSGGSDLDRTGETPLHIVDGHFGHYGDCCPGSHEPRGLLFGKYEGRYWRQAHIRGNPERGVVVTDRELVVDP